MPHDKNHRFRQAFLDMRNATQVYRAERDDARSVIRRYNRELREVTAQRDALRRRIAYIQSDRGVEAILHAMEGSSSDERTALKAAMARVIEEHRRRDQDGPRR